MSPILINNIINSKISIKEKNNSSKIKDKSYKTNIIDKTHNADIRENLNEVNVMQVLPFRIRFKNLSFGQSIPNSSQPIGIALVGFNNYIL